MKHITFNRRLNRRILSSAALPVALALLAGSVYIGRRTPLFAQALSTRFPGATSSQPLAISADGAVLVSVNPDNDTVSVFDVSQDRNRRIAEVRVGSEPNGVAVVPNGSRAFIANSVSGTVTSMQIYRGGVGGRVLRHIPVGTEPYAVVMTPNGRKLYVANARSNTISVIDPNTNSVIRTVNVGPEPRGLAVTNNGDANDDDETLLVTHFLALPSPGRVDGEDDSKLGFVTALSTRDESMIAQISLRPMPDTGFKAAGDAIGRMAPPATITEADLKFTTGAYPNQLNSVAVKGGFAFVPSTAASPNGPVRFDVNTQSLLSVIDLTRRTDAGQTVNMHAAVRDQTGTPKRFITQPWSIAMKNGANEGYVISLGSNIMVKLAVNPTTGAASVQRSVADNTRVLQIPTGRHPRGVVVNPTDTRAYVMNYISRDVTVVDLSATPERVSATMRSADLPAPGSPEEVVHLGKELYHTSLGEFDPATPGGAPITGRMSNNGWGSCGSCHPFGLTDNVVWIFGAGPRRTIPQHTDFDPVDSFQRALNWSAIFDEEEDFEANIRGTSGGLGLIVGSDGVTPDNPVGAFTPASAERRQLRVRGINSWDAIKAYVQNGIRAPISPLSKSDPDVVAGEEIFRQNNCQQCHGGTQWTTARVNHTGVPGADLLLGAQLGANLKKVGTFDATAKNEIRAAATAPLGADGYAPASLLSLFAFPQTFFHNGQANSLEQAMENVTHRSAGTNGVDRLTDPEQRRRLIRFVLSIDAATVPMYPPQ
ncbi:MAG: hypothetical protein EXQ52_14540 [Bryobacterales bacterium]|nr:hypothetical protein [Bryobacterales bacterium]